MRIVRELGLSLGLFAPGWSFECGEAGAQKDDAERRRCDEGFWDALGVERCFRRGP